MSSRESYVFHRLVYFKTAVCANRAVSARSHDGSPRDHVGQAHHLRRCHNNRRLKVRMSLAPGHVANISVGPGPLSKALLSTRRLLSLAFYRLLRCKRHDPHVMG